MIEKRINIKCTLIRKVTLVATSIGIIRSRIIAIIRHLVGGIRIKFMILDWSWRTLHTRFNSILELRGELVPFTAKGFGKASKKIRCD